jgi:biopolymer transport protein ExbD
MKLRTLPADVDVREEINLTPMLDVVFILLIFFIVTATFIRETGLVAGTAEGEPSATEEPDAILVFVDANYEYWIDRRPVPRTALRAHLALLHVSHPEFPVVIQAANDSSVQMLVTALDMARAVGIEDVVVAQAPGQSAEP